MGSNVASSSASSNITSSKPLIYSGDDYENLNRNKFWAGANLGLQAQSITDSGEKAWGASIVLEGGKEDAGAANRVDGNIQFYTGGYERIRFTNDGLYIFSGNVPVRLQTAYNSNAPYDCTFETNINYNTKTQLVDFAPYGTASMQVNANQTEGGYISMKVGARNTLPTEVVRVTGTQMNVLNISTGYIRSGEIRATGNISTSGIFYGNGSGLINLSGVFSSNPNKASLRYYSPATSQNTTNSIWGGFSGSNPRIYVNINNIMGTYITTKYLVASGDLYTNMAFNGGGNTNNFTRAPDNGGLPYYNLYIELTNSTGTEIYNIFYQSFSTALSGNFGADTVGSGASVNGIFVGPNIELNSFPGMIYVQDTKKNNSIMSQMFTMVLFGAYTVSFRLEINMQMQSGDNGANYTASMVLPSNGPIKVIYE